MAWSTVRPDVATARVLDFVELDFRDIAEDGCITNMSRSFRAHGFETAADNLSVAMDTLRTNVLNLRPGGLLWITTDPTAWGGGKNSIVGTRRARLELVVSIVIATIAWMRNVNVVFMLPTRSLADCNHAFLEWQSFFTNYIFHPTHMINFGGDCDNAELRL